KFFISWRFVGEPRYSAETKSRIASVQPAGTGGPLPVEFYSEYKGVPWEAVADFYPVDRLQIRMGRQFISWGETDGQRLIDLINPQNLTFAPPAPNLFNLDETRIPQWGLRLLYTVRPVSNTVFEFFANPGFEPKKLRVDNFSPTNDIGDGKPDGDQRYGRWSSHPEDRMAVARMFANPLGPVPVVVPLASRDYPDAGDSWKIGTRITHNFGALSAGLGYILGYNPQASDMVFKTGAVGCLPPGVPPTCQIGPGFTPTTVQLRLVNDRTHIFAGHLNYPIDEPLGIPIKSAMRGEIAFYPNKPYNISNFPGINCATGVSTGLRAGPSCKHPSNIVEKNTIRYSLGFDRSTFIPFLQDDPWRAFRMTFQIFQSIILDHEKGIRTFGHASKINQVSTLLTFRVNTGYLGDTILPDIFVGYDPDGYYIVNPAVTYQPPWNEKLQLTLTSAIYGGHNKYKSLGFFSEKDSVFLKLRYQF
ncbi:MAG TPA: DUF1302 family protein, partial [Candidatus Limnocylindria bacterium]|nr:DUF1302 family protein [Candidatus Limnocylindria bacterium]